MSNPIKTTSRDYDSILIDINSDSTLKNRPEWFKRMMSGIGDVLNNMLDLHNNESILNTAQTRTAIADKLALIDYYLSPQSTSSGTAIFFLDQATITYPQTFTAAELVATTQGTVGKVAMRFEAIAPVTLSALVSEVFTNTGDVITVTRDFMTGEKVQCSTAGTLPDPLSALTDYWVIRLSATTISLATSLANAISGIVIPLTDVGSGIHTIELYSIQVDLYQRESIVSAKVGVGDGTAFQEVDLPDLNILADTSSVTVNAITYTYVTSFGESVSTDNHFMVIYRTDGTAYLRFGGNGFSSVLGLFDIYCEYAIGGGVDSNISDDNVINTYSGSNALIKGITNTEDFTGGGAEESTATAKRIAPLSLSARNRFVKTSDGEALALENYAISKIKIIRNAYGALSCNVLIVPPGGGAPSSSVKTSLQAYLIDRTILESVDVRVNDPTYIVKNVVSAVKVKTGYLYANILPYVTLGWRLLLSETGQEIKDDYESNGISSAITLINSIFTMTFTSADNTVITTLIEAFTPVDFGDTVTESDIYGLLDSSIDGVDYITYSSPVLPFTLAATEISQAGSIAITEIP